MTKQYRTREGEATAVDTKTQLTTLGSESAPGPLLVPQGTRTLVEVIAAVSADFAAAGSASALVRLEGAGLPAGPEVIAVGALGYNLVTGGHVAMAAKKVKLEVPVTPGNEVLVFGEMCGADVGSMHFHVTLVFK